MSETSPLTVIIDADPGLPARRAHALREDLETTLTDLYGEPVSVRLTEQPVGLLPHGDIDTPAAQELLQHYERCDALLLLTEVPRRSQGKPLIAEAFPAEGVGVVSCPTLGAWATHTRIREVLVSTVVRLVPDRPAPDTSDFERRWSGWRDREDRGSTMLRANTLTGAPRLVLGMVAANEPARTIPRLSGALAAAMATGAFGVFYSSTWQMASSLPPWRLGVIAVMAVLVMVTWLIVANGLWDRAVTSRRSTVLLLYNLSTVVTLMLAVMALYAVMVVAILLAALLVIDASFMEQVLGEVPAATSYIRLAVLAAAMGVVAGALGSNFDDSTDVRRLTHGQRERSRVKAQQE
ncbi:hypothetical protein [Serinibacter salmoneus]|uniref:Uncharacterized protein n=1 Tax=Serinibacter salmoneus TaxID=556530 RepID=A0A2A9D4F4_9MICO|nr:hypothetical protein [Serinibacter salmoneus]PFG21135.1 hypothetical protein ATL40_2756 [Serinibacter salmoneus]